MLWNLYGNQAEQFFRCWNTCKKLSWDLPRSTHSYFVDSLLSSGMPSTRQQALSRYVKFFRSLLSSPSKEVAIIARVIGQNATTTTGKNLLNISLETNLSTWSSPLSKFHEVIEKEREAPEEEKWRISLLQGYLKIRQEQLLSCCDTEYIDNLISSLCST